MKTAEHYSQAVPSRQRYFQTLTILLLAVLLSPHAVAHNKVVVIPMTGDDAALEPFAPITSDSPQNGDYIIGTATVVDKITGLEWQRFDDNNTRIWNFAWNYCANLTISVKDDWRIPSIGELQSIASYGNFNPAINGLAFANTNSTFYWSASKVEFNSLFVWHIDFIDGRVGYSTTDQTRYVRCVRQS